MTFNIEIQGSVIMNLQLCAKSEDEARRIATDYFQEVLKPTEDASTAEKRREITVDLDMIEQV